MLQTELNVNVIYFYLLLTTGKILHTKKYHNLFIFLATSLSLNNNVLNDKIVSNDKWEGIIYLKLLLLYLQLSPTYKGI